MTMTGTPYLVELNHVATRNVDTYTFLGTVGTPAPDSPSEHNLLELLAACFPGQYMQITIHVPKAGG